MSGEMSKQITEPAVSSTGDANLDLKRKRSPSLTTFSPPAKTVKTSANHLSINYLARSSQEDLPLANKEDSLPNILHLLTQYTNVLERHESLASNLGARPLGPILIKKFERCFDAPPRIVASHQRTNNNVTVSEDLSQSITWLEVIEFARSHPVQFTLSAFSEGQRVCQFYMPQKQLRVQITEEDFIFINSGRCQELIPPLPIWEDEEKEVSTCDVLDARLKELTNVADMVAARTRQLCHRLKNRRAAILERRAEGGSGTPAKAVVQQTTTAPPHPSSNAFTTVNHVSHVSHVNRDAQSENCISSSPAMRTDLLRHFESLPQNQTKSQSRPIHDATSSSSNVHRCHDLAPASSQSPVPQSLPHNDARDSSVLDASGQRPSSASTSLTAGSALIKHNFSRPLPAAMENSQPLRAICQSHMDRLYRGQRVIPPCDRCRRLRMDCVKNLTSCAGCTKKHARCHWQEVSQEELAALHLLPETGYLAPSPSGAEQNTSRSEHEITDDEDDDDDNAGDDDDDDDDNPLNDIEAVRQESLRESEMELQKKRQSGIGRHSDLESQASAATLISTTATAHDISPGPTSSASAVAREISSSSLRSALLPSHTGFVAAGQSSTGGFRPAASVDPSGLSYKWEGYQRNPKSTLA